MVLNDGDPVHRLPHGSSTKISHSDEIFLKFISYLPFAESIIVPTRHLLDGDAAFSAAVMARPLLRNGLIIPERRSGPSSFGEVANDRGLGQLEKSRAQFLDQNVAQVREIRWADLSGLYRTILLDDLGPNGSFRRTVPGGLKGANKDALDKAFATYLSSGETTPEGFFSAVEAACPTAAHLAKRWAMARYCVTPANFDDVHIRQVPNDAANLLLKGQAIDTSLKPIGELPPAEHLFQQISIGLSMNEIEKNAQRYCEAALRVRDDIPQARDVFRKILAKADTVAIGEAVTAAMQAELEKQLHTSYLDKNPFSLGIDILGGAIGGLIGLPVGLLGGPSAIAGSLATGAVVGAGTAKVAKEKIKSTYDHRNRPWKLAIDRLKTEMSKLK